MFNTFANILLSVCNICLVQRTWKHWNSPNSTNNGDTDSPTTSTYACNGARSNGACT